MIQGVRKLLNYEEGNKYVWSEKLVPLLLVVPCDSMQHELHQTRDVQIGFFSLVKRKFS
jgi:hypothetical protein